MLSNVAETSAGSNIPSHIKAHMHSNSVSFIAILFPQILQFPQAKAKFSDKNHRQTRHFFLFFNVFSLF
jgi:hypothetical protein